MHRAPHRYERCPSATGRGSTSGITPERSSEADSAREGIDAEPVCRPLAPTAVEDAISGPARIATGVQGSESAGGGRVGAAGCGPFLLIRCLLVDSGRARLVVVVFVWAGHGSNQT
jgi:hypothetical protein